MPAKVTLNRTTLFLILAVAAVILGAVLIYLQTGINSSLREEALTEQKLLAQAEARLARYRQLRDQAPAYRQQLADLRRMIPAAPQEDELIRKIYLLADDAELRVVEIRFDERVGKEAFTEIPLAITVEGGYRGLLQLLDMLRAGDRAVRVDQIRVANQGAGIRTVLEGRAFFTAAEPTGDSNQ